MRTKKRTCIGIIAAVPEEGRRLSENLETSEVNSLFYKGKSDNNSVILIFSGMGKVNAAHAATRLILDYNPSFVMNIGIGGAYPSSGLRTGDIAVAEKEIYGDEGVMLENGFHGTELTGIPLLKKGRKKYFNEFALDSDLLKKGVRAAQLVSCHSSGVTVKKGPFLTLSTCTGTDKRAAELRQRFDAICENMEGAAIAHICTLYGIPMLEMRGISNMAGERDSSKWDIKLAACNCQIAALELLKTI